MSADLAGLVPDQQRISGVENLPFQATIPLTQVSRLPEISLDQVFSPAVAGSWEWDIVGGTGSLDARSFEILGLDPGRGMPGVTDVLSRFDPQKRDRLVDAWNRSIRERGAGEVRFRTAGGARGDTRLRVIWRIERDRSGAPMRALGLLIDDTETLLLEQRLALSERYQSLAHTLCDAGNFCIDGQTGVVHWDRRTCAIHGIAQDQLELPIEEARAYVDPADRAAVEERFLQSFNRGLADQFEYRIRIAGGVTRHVIARWLVAPNPETGHDSLMGVLTDVTDDRRRQSALERLVQRLQLATRVGGIGIWDWQASDDRWGFNQVLREQIGAAVNTAQPAGPEYLIDALLREDQPALKRALEQMRKGAISEHSGEYRVATPENRIRYLAIQMRSDAAPDGRVVRISGVTLDVSERKRKASKWQFLVDSVCDGVWEWNVSTGRIYRSDRYSEQFGFEAGSQSHAVSEWLERVHPDDRQQVLDQMQAAISRRTDRYSSQYRLRDRIGEYRWVIDRGAAIEYDVEGKPIRFLGAFMDATRQRQVEQQLRDEQARASLAAAATGMGIYSYDSNADRMWWDDQTYGLFGLQREANPLTFARWWGMVHPDDRPSVRAAIERSVSNRGEHFFEFRIVRADGVVRHLSQRGQTQMENGRLVRTVGVVWDITEKLAADAMARQSADALAACDAAEQASLAKTEFLSRMSHELRTPLNAIVGFSDLLIESALAPAQRDVAGRIGQAGQHLSHLIDDILELSRIESGEIAISLRPVRVLAMFEEALGMVDRMAAATNVHLSIENTLDPDLHVLADDLRLREVICNLLTNAIKYNRSGGRVVLAARALESDQVRMSVIDTGIGIEEHHVARLFEPFDRLGREATGIAGTGIGLTIARTLVERMAARLTVDSIAGEGSEFGIEIARAAGPIGAGGPGPFRLSEGDAPPRAGTAGGARRSILYVEDNALNRVLIEQYLEARPQVELHCAASGAEGLELAVQTDPDLVLIDIHLPDMNGVELLARLRILPGAQRRVYVALSADAIPQSIQDGLAGGFSDYWIKPIRPKDFLTRIDRLLLREQTL